MPLRPTLVQVPVKGMNTRSDPRNAVLGEFELIENMYCRRLALGGAELIKRFGGATLTRNTNLSFPSQVSVGRKLALFNNERLLISDTLLWSYSTQFGVWNGSPGGLNRTSPVGVTVEAVTEGAPQQGSPDCASSGNLLCVAYRDSSLSGIAVAVTVIDLATGQRVISNQRVIATGGGAGNICRVVALATCFMVFGNTGATITAYKIPYANPVTGATTATVDTIFANGNFDAIRNGANDSCLLAYNTTTPNTKILIWNSGMTAGASTTNANNADQCVGWLTWDGSDGNEYLAYVSSAGGGLKLHTVTTAGPAITGTAVLDATVVAASSTTGYRLSGVNNVFVGIANTVDDRSVFRSTGGGVARFQPGASMASRAFLVNGVPYLMVGYVAASPAPPPVETQNGLFLLDVSSTTNVGSVVGKAFYGQFQRSGPTAELPSAAALGSGIIGIPAGRMVGVFGNNSTQQSGPWLVKFDFNGAGLSAPKRLGEALYFPGGVVNVYDGHRISEAGTHLFPSGTTVTPIAGGSMTLLGTYLYRITYSWYNARGERYQSAPSVPIPVTMTGANQTARLTIPLLRMGERNIVNVSGFSRGSTEVWRTVDGGSTYFRVPVWVHSTGSAADTVQVDDSNSDASIQTQEILYTTGNVLPHIPFPAARLMEVCRNRLFLAGTENPLELWVSNEYITGEAVSVSDALVIAMESEGGPITALAEMDDRLIVFKRSAIYALAGQGPTTTGAGMYDQPARLTSIVGVTGPDGIVKTRDGLMFKSLRGIYLLDHGLQVTYIGAAVEAYNNLTVTGACVMEDLEQVRFVCNDGSGTTLVYHYGLKDETGVGLWTTFTNRAAVDTIVWNGRWVTLASDGTVTEETTAYVDPGSSPINAYCQFSWWNLGGLFGDVRLWRVRPMLDPKATFTLQVSYAIDHDPSTIIATPGLAVGFFGLGVPVEVRPARQSAAAWQWVFEETSTTQGFTLSGVSLELGAEGRLRRLAPAKEF